MGNGQSTLGIIGHYGVEYFMSYISSYVANAMSIMYIFQSKAYLPESPIPVDCLIDFSRIEAGRNSLSGTKYEVQASAMAAKSIASYCHHHHARNC